ncbi:hypothetical protein HMPREF3232_00452 [Fannyhessea vaginae]|nr:hypothetical protein HMPREF3232_00452 [Fannyhessea vaginae]
MLTLHYSICATAPNLTLKPAVKSIKGKKTFYTAAWQDKNVQLNAHFLPNVWLSS